MSRDTHANMDEDRSQVPDVLSTWPYVIGEKENEEQSKMMSPDIFTEAVSKIGEKIG